MKVWVVNTFRGDYGTYVNTLVFNNEKAAKSYVEDQKATEYNKRHFTYEIGEYEVYEK